MTSMIFDEPDIGTVFSLPPQAGKMTFQKLMPHYAENASKFAEFWDALDLYRRKNADDVSLAEYWAEYAVMAGRAEDAALALKKLDSTEQYSIAGMAALTRGENDKALSLYEEGLKLLRKTTGKRKVSYLSWTGIFYPILLLGKGAKTSDGVPRKKIEDYLESAFARLGRYLLGAVLDMLPFLFSHKMKNDGFWRYESMYAKSQDKYLDVFFFVLFAYWLDAKRASEMQSLILKAYDRLTSMKLEFLASELAAVIRDLWPDAAINHDRTALPRYPLKDLISGQPEWERSLDALSGIGGGTVVRGAKRLVWEISWKPDDIGKSFDRRPSYIKLTPVEQTLSHSGWSRGKNVALRRLYRKADTVPSATDQDRRAASAVQEGRDYYGTVYTIDVLQALEALAGHPYLFREEDGGRVEVAVGEPQLLAMMSGGSYRLSISPFPPDGKAPQRVVQEDGPNCLRVTRFEERHIKMAGILSEDGLLFPGRAKEAILKTLGVLASAVTVHSDIEGIEASTVQVEADARIYIQLQPCDDGLAADGMGGLGANGLDVDMVVRPLGPGSVPCRPGTGGQNIFGLVDSRRAQARRSLEKEKDSLMLAVRACPALTEAEQITDGRWRLPAPELALEFLTQVQELGDSVVAEWPKGQTMSVRSNVSMSSMGLSVRGTKDWFAVSGELKVDEKLVLNMKDLMILTKTGYGRFIPVGDGQFVALEKEFRRRLETISAMGDTKGNELRVSPLSVGILSPLLDGVGFFEGGVEWNRALACIEEAAVLTPPLPSTFKGKLRNYQAEGYQWMSRLAHWGAGACLADDMGLGKTIQALALLVARGSGGPALVVAPTSVCANWEAEAGRFAPTLNVKELRYGDREKTLEDLKAFDVVITTYGLLQSEADLLSAVRWRTIVLDEAQAIKNMGTKRSAAAMKLKGDFRVATTGTPIENHLGELWNIFHFINPHFLGSLESFSRRFIVPIERYGDKDARLCLKKLIQPFILRRSKEQVLEELPPKTEITIRVELKEEEGAFYEALRRNAVEELSNNDSADRRFRIFAELMRLRRACCNTSLVMPEKNFPSAKMEAFLEILGEMRDNGHKALVFSQFVGHLAIIENYLNAEKIPYQYLDGSTTPQERARRVAAFQSGDGDCFLISLKAGGTGLNLTAADYVIHMDPWWNPAVEEQASDRAHRIGQNRPVTVYRIVAKNTIEEKIVDLHAWKRGLAESLLDDAGVPARLSAEEMLELILEAK